MVMVIFFAPEYFKELDESLQIVTTLYLTVNRQNVPFLWPIRLPGPDGRVNSWHSTAREAAEYAMKAWIRVVSNHGLGGYQQWEAKVRFSDPEWPDLTMGEILAIAFKDRLVTGPDHPVMLRLHGAI